MTHPHYNHLKLDKKFKPLLGDEPLPALQIKKNVCLELCSSILSQQLSIKAAAVIYGRFLALFKRPSPSPKDILAIPFDTLKGVGMSTSKTTYIRNVCHFFIEHKLTDRQLHAMADDEIIALLTQIKGVGQWTVHMLLMFTMGRDDVFAPDDLGIRQGMIRLYRLENLDKKELIKKMTAISSKWSPYRSYGCRYLWSWKDR